MEVDVESAKQALDRLINSQTFARSQQLRRFLKLTVDRTLEGRADDLKEYTVAVEAYGRPASYDPRVDAIVRTEARRLRKKLLTYYQTEGRNDPVHIHYPKGSYVPKFVRSSERAASSKSTESVSRSGRPRGFWWAALALVVLAGLLVSRSRHVPASRRLPRVAVLPFEDLSGDGRHPELALAMTESLLTRLARVHGLEVVSRSTSLGSFDTAELEALSRKLGVDYLVRGSILRSGDECRVAARLVETNGFRQVWAQSYDYPWSDVFAMQDAVAQGLTDQLVAATVSREDVPTANLDSYDLYLKGHFSAVEFYNRREEHVFETAERRLLEAVALDPQLDEAWTELGRIYYARLYPPREDRQAVLETSREFLERALSVDPDNATALSLLGAVDAQSGRAAEGVEKCRRAAALEPGNADTHDFLGQVYAWRGFYESAIFEYERALALDPLLLSPLTFKSEALCLIGRCGEALETTRRLQELQRGPVADVYRGDVLHRLGDETGAERAWRAAAAAGPMTVDTGYAEVALGLAAARTGDLQEARRVLDKYRGLPYRTMSHLTEIAALLDEPDVVIEQIAGHPERNYRWLVGTRAFDGLKDEPAFAELASALYTQWLADFRTLRGSLPVPPAPVPSIEDYLGVAEGPEVAGRRVPGQH